MTVGADVRGAQLSTALAARGRMFLTDDGLTVRTLAGVIETYAASADPAIGNTIVASRRATDRAREGVFGAEDSLASMT